MKKEALKRYTGQLRWLWLSALIFVLDQGTKHIAVQNLTLNKPNQVLPFFNFTLVHNKGSAFGFLQDVGPIATYFFAAVALVVSGLLLYWLFRVQKDRWLGAALALILGGALGNLVSRVAHGYVIDFLDFHIADWHWPAFNVADTAIVIGAVMLIIDVFMKKAPNVDESL